MKLPFTIQQFLDVFRQYNIAVWPMQVFIIVLALVAVYFSIRSKTYSNKIVVCILAFFWLWMGIIYHLVYFSRINKAAIVFGTLFIIQAIIFIYFGLIKNKLRFRFKTDKYGITGIILIVFALLIYPLLGYWWGRIYPSSPTFGLPCPTTIFTFGILLFSVPKISTWVIVIPVLWSLIGFTAAFSLGIKEDTGLVIAGLLSMAMILYRNKSFRASL
jgi:Family of unknown function (DUF6064)